MTSDARREAAIEFHGHIRDARRFLGKLFAQGRGDDEWTLALHQLTEAVEVLGIFAGTGPAIPKRGQEPQGGGPCSAS